MTPIHEEQIVVDADDIDRLGHVNNLAYLRWAVESAVNHSVLNGWPFERYEALGAGWVVRTHQITYLRPAFAGDTVRLRTWIGELSRATCRRKYRMERSVDGVTVLLAEAFTDWVFVDFAKQTPRRIPAEVLESFVLVAEGPDGVV